MKHSSLKFLIDKSKNYSLTILELTQEEDPTRGYIMN